MPVDSYINAELRMQNAEIFFNHKQCRMQKYFLITNTIRAGEFL